jgi:hypothetical protein
MVYQPGTADLALFRRDEPTASTELIETLRGLSH